MAGSCNGAPVALALLDVLDKTQRGRWRAARASETPDETDLQVDEHARKLINVVEHDRIPKDQDGPDLQVNRTRSA
eukprot:COSAG03_NODE_1982_length_3262_cov_27.853304_5_plen_76_part_00